MKTLGEVIEAMKCFDPEKECAGCPYEELHHMGSGIGPSCIDMLAQDALYYLKMYKELANDSALFAKWKENPPLTWDQLKQMKGQPVWVEYNLHLSEAAQKLSKAWFIISDFKPLGKNEMMIMKNRFAFTDYEIDAEWKAYRKERNDG